MKPYPWQKKQWQQLLSAFSSDRLSHAYLLSGISGLGKVDFAHAFSRVLLCQSVNKSTGVVCGQCKGCRLIKAGTHPDFIEIRPHESGHAIKIDQVRQLTRNLTQKSQYGGYQVVLISAADSMPVGAANALLKTLEEPLGDVVIFLVADCVDKLPATILSRCQQMYFQAENGDETITWLKTQLSAEDDVANLLAIAGGAPLTVKRLVEANYLALRNSILKHLLLVLTDYENPVKPVADWIKQDNALVLYALQTVALDVSRIQVGVQDGLINVDAVRPLEKMSTIVSQMQLQLWIQRLLEKKQMIERGLNLNMQLVLEELMLRWGK